MYATLMQSVSALTVCILGATRTPSPAVQAAHIALSFPYALKLASTPFGVIPVPLSVGVGHPRPSSNRVRVVAVAARRCCSCLTPCFPRRASKKNYFGQKIWDSARWHGTGQSTNYGKNDGGELPSMHQPGRAWGGSPSSSWCTSTTALITGHASTPTTLTHPLQAYPTSIRIIMMGQRPRVGVPALAGGPVLSLWDQYRRPLVGAPALP